MKRSAFIVLFIVPVSCVAYGQSFRSKADALRAPSDIVDYFLIAPLNTYLHPVYTAGSEYADRVKLLTGGRDKKTAMIDVKNAYLNVRFKDENGNDNDITMTYFTCADSSRIIGVSSCFMFDGAPSYKHHFLRYRGGKFVEVTKNVLPGLSFKDFMRKGASIPARMDEYLMSTTANFVLPRNGTSIRVEMKNKHPYLPDCDIEFPEDLYLAIYKSRIYKEIEMNFDREKGVFTIGRAK